MQSLLGEIKSKVLGKSEDQEAKEKEKEAFELGQIQEGTLAESIPLLDKEWREEREKSTPDLGKKFQYAYVLSKSDTDRHRNVGLLMFQELIRERYNVEECMYCMAVTLYMLKEYKKCKSTLEMLLRRNPEHHYASNLLVYSEMELEKKNEEATLIAGVGVSVAVGSALILGALLGGKKGGGR